MIKKIWQASASLFDPVQEVFNKDFWKVFVKKMGNFSNEDILDIACGTGELRDYIKPRKYLGVDINPSYIKYATENRSIVNTKFVVSDITDISLKSKYNKAVLISALHHLSDQQIYDLCRNLKKNKVRELLVVDGYPIGFLKGILEKLDSLLAGGDYFRKEDEIVKLLQVHGEIINKGTFSVPGSYYMYPYALLKFS